MRLTLVDPFLSLTFEGSHVLKTILVSWIQSIMTVD